MRTENEIFSELAELCTSSGYVHVIAYFCFRDNAVWYSDKITSQAYIDQYSTDHLIRSEISTLLGLMVKKKIDLTIPEAKELERMIDQTEKLLQELHKTIIVPMASGLTASTLTANPFTQGTILREAFFYGSESAYDFQYIDFALKKYKKDYEWLQSQKGISIENAKIILNCIEQLQNQKLLNHFNNLREGRENTWTMLPGFVFSIEELVSLTGFQKSIISNFLNAFILPKNNFNQNLIELNDFNIANAFPLINLETNTYLLFQGFSLAEALYESPFYWMVDDPSYKDRALQNRGDFTEDFTLKKLESVFGKENVYLNVQIIDKDKPKKGKKAEIDILVLYGDKAIVVQAKSKRLTLVARKGNDNAIKDDFKKSIQTSYNQGLLCAKQLIDKNYQLIDVNSNRIPVKYNINEVYIFCVISDHYPALSFQSRQFLQWEENAIIRPPLALDIFTLDVITEMLNSPLYFLSYINRRANYFDKIIGNELAILAYHLKKNLWFDNTLDGIVIDDTVSLDLDIAMRSRRKALPGDVTPPGILTNLNATLIKKLLNQFLSFEDPIIIDIGFLILSLNEKVIMDLSASLDHMINLAKTDKKSHNLTLSIADNSGLTIYCTNDPVESAHAQLNQYGKKWIRSQQVKSWFAICIEPMKFTIRFGMKLEHDNKMETPS